MNNIFIVGGTNQIGHFLLPILENSYHISALSRKENFSEKINWIQSDIQKLDKRTIKKLNIDILIYIGSMEYINDFLNKFSSLSRLILFSSTSTITKEESNIENERILSKNLLEGENKAKIWCSKNNVNLTILRPTLIYGINKDKNITVITNFIKRFKFFPIIGKGKGLRKPVHSYDLAKAAYDVINNSKTFGKTYSLTGLETLTYKQMIVRVFESINQRAIIINIPEWLFKILLYLLKIFPKYRYLSTGMIDRINQDLCFDIKDAQNDFNYSPMIFTPNKEIQ